MTFFHNFLSVLYSEWSVLLIKFCLLLQVQRFIRLLINRSHSSSVTQYEDYETACERICKVSAGEMVLFYAGPKCLVGGGCTDFKLTMKF